MEKLRHQRLRNLPKITQLKSARPGLGHKESGSRTYTVELLAIASYILAENRQLTENKDYDFLSYLMLVDSKSRVTNEEKEKS